MTPTTDDWHECRVSLPTPENWLVLDLGSQDPQGWAHAVAEQHLAPGSGRERRDAFAEDLLWYWLAAARQRALCAALLAPADSAIIASYTVRELRIPPASLSVAALRAEAAQAEGPFFGNPKLSEVELPLGSALRVHRQEPTAPDSDSGVIVEGVAHYVLPRRSLTVLECRLLWTSLGLGEELCKIADELAASVRLA
ncbi:hypothetical protein [Streptomyces sp. NPDC002779]|uniref:hypothetical protein n=1 Tax=Streptomyces sp. NPDC002779 TaxID=3364664 RepID=UPI003688E3FA